MRRVPVDHTDPCEGGGPGSAGLGVPEGNQSSGSSGVPAWAVSPALGGAEALGWLRWRFAQSTRGCVAAVGAVPLLGYLLTSTAPGSRKTAPQRAAQRPGLGERNGERSTKERSGAGLGQSSLPVPGALGALTSARGHGSGARHIFHTITGGTSWHTGLSLQGRHLGAHPVNPFLEAAGSFPGCPRCPWLGAIPQRGRVFAAGPPEKINAAGPAAQHGTGIAGAWPRCLLSAQPRGAAALNTNICVGSAKKKNPTK